MNPKNLNSVIGNFVETAKAERASHDQVDNTIHFYCEDEYFYCGDDLTDEDYNVNCF